MNHERTHLRKWGFGMSLESEEEKIDYCREREEGECVRVET